MDISRKALGQLTPAQDAVAALLAKFLAAAKRGELDAVVIAAASCDGAMQIDFKGAGGLECALNMGLDVLKGNVKGSFLHAQAPEPQILRPEGGIIKLS
jgi:NAD(P)-dependent dehydrogenase (short-subunit alcohol dehydrogenase family)